MKLPSHTRRTLALVGVLAALLGAALFVAVRSGPLAPVPVTVTTVRAHSIAPALFGVGTVEARYTYKLGPTAPGRLAQVHVQVGDRVRQGQTLGEMDPVDLGERLSAQDAALKRAAASVSAAEARVDELVTRARFAATQRERSERLFAQGSLSEQALDVSRQERDVAQVSVVAAQASLESARQDLLRLRAERAALVQQRASLLLLSPVAGLVIARHADPGTTAVAGQAVLELVDPASLWIHVRFDEQSAVGLRAGLPARVQLRSRSEPVPGRVLRVEPIADAVTEEILAKVELSTLPDPLPPLGTLCEVSVMLPELPAAPSVPNASLRRHEGMPGVWLIDDAALRFAPVKVGAADLDGRVQILEGLQEGAQVVLYSQRALGPRQRVAVVDALPGVPR